MLTRVIFVGAYAAIAAGRVPFLRIDRTGAALIGAVLMVATGAISLDAAARAVDPRTLVLLFSMMVMVAYLRMSGGLGRAADFVGRVAQGPRQLVACIVLAAGMLSALFVNDTVCIVFTPIVLEVAAARGQHPLPYLVALATASNIGSAATITGNPQNILIGSLSRIAFPQFVARLGPLSLICLAIDVVLVCVVFRRQLAERTKIAIVPVRRPVHRMLLVKTLMVSAAVLAGFFAGYDAAIVAAAGAAALLVTRRVRPAKVYRAIDWDLLMLFAGLFVIVAAGAESGIDREMLSLLRPIGVATIAGLSATVAILSNAVSNVPAVMLFTRVIPALPDPQTGWLTLSMASTFAGNATIMGSIANLIVVEGARRRGVAVKFWDYGRVGLPISVLTIALGILWLGLMR